MQPPLAVLVLCGALALNGCESPGSDQLEATAASPQTVDWAPFWSERHRSKLAERAAMRRVDMVWLGDSLTHFWETEGRATWQARYAGRGALNLGFAGDSTEHLLWRLRNGEVDGMSPKVAIVLIGTNNAGVRREKPEHTAAGIRAIVTELRARLPQTKILLLALFPRGATPRDPTRILNARTNRLIAGLADGAYVHFLDIGARFLAPDGTLSPEIMPDLLHLSPRGYEIWADAIGPTLDVWLGDGHAPAQNWK